jgi:aspartate/methionine/tyrosine aminotransferase
MHGIAPFHVMELLAQARMLEAEGRSIIHLEIGEPDFATPRPICEAGIRALERGDTFYTPATGVPELREAVARFYQGRYGVDVSPDRVVITSGSSAALLMALGVLVDPGAEVLLTDPGYPANRHLVRLLNGEAVSVPVDAGCNCQLSAELVRRHWTERTAAVLVATPSNPTGALLDYSELVSIAEVVSERGGTLIVDEIYHGLVYDAEVRTGLEACDSVFVINSFSKYFNMTGWRLGWMVAPMAYVREIEKLAQNVYLSPPAAAQYAALAAFAPETIAILDERREAFRTRRDFLLPELRRLGFEVPQTPQGAFYIYAGCRKLADDSLRFAHALLQEEGVAVTPGIDFGAHRADEYVRFAYTRSIEVLREGVARIERFIARAR